MRRDRQRFADILEALDWISNATAGLNEADFLANDTLCYAVAQKLTIIGRSGGAAQSRGEARYDSVPWADIVALRNILVLCRAKWQSRNG